MTHWIPRPQPYGKAGMLTDLNAGLTLGILLIPQAMAYGMLAGVGPVFGLYAAIIPMLVYGLLASTPHVSVGPTALASLLCLSGLSDLATPGTPEYLNYAFVLAGLTGVLQLIFGILRLGGIVSLLSRPVLSGFVSAAAILIVVSQLDALFGIATESSDYFHQTIISLIKGMGQVHLPTAILGVGALFAMVASRRWLPKHFPFTLFVIIATTLLVWLFGADWQVVTVGEVPAGLPALAFPEVDLPLLRQLFPIALVMALISFIETLSIGKAFSPKYDYYRISPNREAIALGLSKIIGAIFQAVPTSASFSRSAVVEEGNGKTAASNLVAVLLLLLVLLFFTSPFYYLPIPVLAAVIIYSVRNLFDLAEMRRLGMLAPKELLTLLITFFFTLFAGLEYGIAGGVVLSLIFVFWRAARPHLAELGRIPNTNAFRNVQRFSQAEADPSVLIVRFDAELYFGNAEYFRNQLERLVIARGDQLKTVIIDGHTINDIDTTGLFELSRFVETLAQKNIALYLCGMIGPVRDKLFKSGLMQQIGTGHQCLSIQSAILHLENQSDDQGWDGPAVQHD
ncbi:MAG: sulfate permease [Bacteroidota bacterium]